MNIMLIGLTSHFIDIGKNLSKGNHTEAVQGITRPSLIVSVGF